MVQVWGVHMDAGVGTKPVEAGYVAIGWSEVGDLSKIAPDRDAFKQVVDTTFPEAKPGAIRVHGGVLYRFVHVVEDGDFVIYPSKVDRMVNIGRISGMYRYSPELDVHYPNVRDVTWLAHIPRDEFSQAALYEIGSFITLFSVRNYAAEFLARVGVTGAPSAEPERVPAEAIEEREDDAAIAQAVSTQAEETTSDFVVRQLKTGIGPYEFEHFVAHLLTHMGYHTRVTQKSGDGGVDIIAHRDELGFEPPIIKVQCKQVTSPIGRPLVSQLVGNVESGEHGLFVTLGSYTREATEYGRAKPRLRLLDGEQLVDLIFVHYRKFDPKYQALLPLKQIYVPSLEGASR